MKKSLSIFLLILMFVLSACGAASGTKTLVNEDENTTVKVSYKGDTITAIETLYTESFSDLDLTSEEEAQELIDMMGDMAQSEEGIEMSFAIEDESIVTTIKMDIAKLAESDSKILKDFYLDADNLSLKEFEKSMKEEGYTVK
ncbi:DUF1307 domain-containing protein [Bacteroides heparinolyticus]|uniref:DUF1307 domain-containing protein n=1 Tax=Prevotella heparinolytica TaxID=28113 RepID=UPI0035A1C8C2